MPPVEAGRGMTRPNRSGVVAPFEFLGFGISDLENGKRFEVSSHRCAVRSLSGAALFQTLSLHQSAKENSEYGEKYC
jgi:hypothetical protein